jgi:hypothetical protein
VIRILIFLLWLQTVVLKVKMSCTGCSGAVNRVLEKLEGIFNSFSKLSLLSYIVNYKHFTTCIEICLFFFLNSLFRSRTDYVIWPSIAISNLMSFRMLPSYIWHILHNNSHYSDYTIVHRYSTNGFNTVNALMQ